MQSVYVPNKPPNAISAMIFLAGPSPRDKSHPNWRDEALQLLEEMKYNGVVFVPLPIDIDSWHHGYDMQIEWEQLYLAMADRIVFWVPRSEELPAFTTNIEWGAWVKSGKVNLGFPGGTRKMKYYQYECEQYGIPVSYDLRSTLEQTLELLGEGALRRGGERYIPLHIWKDPRFQAWKQELPEDTRILHAEQIILNHPSDGWMLKVTTKQGDDEYTDIITHTLNVRAIRSL